MAATHYEVLGVAPGASTAEVRRAYHDAARRHHPDLHSGDGTAMAAVNAAWAVLGDTDRRRAYDREIGTRMSPARAAPPAAADDEDDEPQPAWLMEPDVDLRSVGLGTQAVVLVPAGLLACAVGLFALSTVMASSPLMLLAVVLVPIAGASFVAAPLLMIRKSRQRSGEQS